MRACVMCLGLLAGCVSLCAPRPEGTGDAGPDSGLSDSGALDSGPEDAGTGDAGDCPGLPSPPQSGGSTSFVAPSGLDSNPGTQAQPFATIQHAADTVNPGDTVVVEDGTYTNPAGGAIVSAGRGGTATNWVWFKAEHHWAARLDGNSNTCDTGFRFTNGAGWIRIEGFEIFGVGAGNGSGTGVEIYSGGHDADVVDCDIHDVGRLCTDTTNGECGIFVEQPNVVIEANVIHDIGRYAPGENGCNPTTAYYQNHDHGIYADGDNLSAQIPGTQNLVARNNVIYNTSRGWGIQVYPGTIDGLSILNNTFAFANPYRTGQIILDNTLSNADIENNIFYQPGGGAAIDTSSGPTLSNVLLSNNLTTEAAMIDAPAAGVTLANNLLNTDPHFVDAAGADFHLAGGSPAIDVGASLPNVQFDRDGCVRPRGAGWDIGAYEY